MTIDDGGDSKEVWCMYTHFFFVRMCMYTHHKQQVTNTVFFSDFYLVMLYTLLYWLSCKESNFLHHQTNARLADFTKHKVTWIHGWHSSSWWWSPDLEIRGLRTLVEVTDGELNVQNSNANFQMFQEVGALVASLKICAKQKDLHCGSRIHADICKRGLLQNNIYVATALVNLYAKCGALRKAQEVFDELPVRDAVTWNAIITGYAQHGLSEEALNCFEWMQREGLSPDARTFVCILKACASLGAAEKGEKIHAQIVDKDLVKKDVFMGTALVDMYAKFGAVSKAQEVFDELQLRSVASWNALITGYAQHGHGKQALLCFERMQGEGFSPNACTLVCVLKACGNIGACDKGREIHAEIAREGLLNKDPLISTALVDMYAKCGALAKAQEVFNELRCHDAVSWNALITGYAQHGCNEEALNYFERMQHEGFSPDAVTFTSILKACGSKRAADKGFQLHMEIVSEGLFENDVSVNTALVDMYAKCGSLEEARDVFDELRVRNVVSWTVLIAGYSQHGQGEEAMKCFDWMLQEGFSPNRVTIICVLKACANIGATDKGKQIHAEILRAGLLEKDILVGTALVDMYAKCGALEKAQEVFAALPERDVVLWTTLMAGYAQHGLGEQALNCFELVQQQGLLTPDAVTFNIVLNACIHAGLLEKGQMYFENMNTLYGVKPTSEHYACMVDLFGRAGHFDKVLRMIQKMPTFERFPVWTALLGACLKWKNVKLGRVAFEHAVQLDEKDASAYVTMRNIYAAAAMQEEADKIEAMRVKNKAWKEAGCCWWVDSYGKVHSFIAGKREHPQIERICEKLEDISRKILEKGFSSFLPCMSLDASDDAKEDMLCGHGEKLAIACALINTPEGAAIRVVKNARICGDCHTAASLISKVEIRKISVRDEKRFHVFEDGSCTCGEYV